MISNISISKAIGFAFFIGLILACGLLQVLAIKDRFVLFPLIVAALIVFSWILVLLVASKLYPKGDRSILCLSWLLCAVGLIFVYRLKPELFLLQALWVVTGGAAFLVAALVSAKINRFFRYKYLIAILGIVLLAVALVFGEEINGSRNWVIIGPVRFEPFEFARLLMVIFLAAYLDERRVLFAAPDWKLGFVRLPDKRILAPLVVLWGMAMLVLIVQKDLGAALLFFATAVLLMYIGTGRLIYVLGGALVFFGGSIVCYLLYWHVRVRVDIWLNPWLDPDGRAFQIVQSLFAFAAGGLWGTGIGFGHPSLIPEVHTDFIFAAIGEELGLLGALAVLLAYSLLITRAFRIAMLSRNNFLSLLSAGLACFLALQVFLIIGGVTKFFPLTGVTMPFVSYGGSSMVSTSIILGILFAISDGECNYVEI
ncbi:MAG: FtsW/RodA/SpoVE family cell cycle protein [Negativicutes bacterium]